MDWQKVYKDEACRAADDLAELLNTAASRDEVLEVWERLKILMNHLDVATKEIPL